jgi:hypothetical protein
MRSAGSGSEPSSAVLSSDFSRSSANPTYFCMIASAILLSFKMGVGFGVGLAFLWCLRLCRFAIGARIVQETAETGWCPQVIARLSAAGRVRWRL